MPRSEQRIARAEVREHTLDGVRNEDNIEVEPLGLVQCRNGDPIVFVGLIRKQRTRLKILGLAVCAVVEKGAFRCSLVPPLENLGERRPGGAVLLAVRIRCQVGDLWQRRPDLPQPETGRRFVGPRRFGEQRAERSAVADPGSDDVGPRAPAIDPVLLELGQARRRCCEHRSEEHTAHRPIGFRRSIHIRGCRHHVEDEPNR